MRSSQEALKFPTSQGCIMERRMRIINDLNELTKVHLLWLLWNYKLIILKLFTLSSIWTKFLYVGPKIINTLKKKHHMIQEQEQEPPSALITWPTNACVCNYPSRTRDSRLPGFCVNLLPACKEVLELILQKYNYIPKSLSIHITLTQYTVFSKFQKLAQKHFFCM